MDHIVAKELTEEPHPILPEPQGHSEHHFTVPLPQASAVPPLSLALLQDRNRRNYSVAVAHPEGDSTSPDSPAYFSQSSIGSITGGNFQSIKVDAHLHVYNDSSAAQDKPVAHGEEVKKLLGTLRGYLKAPSSTWTIHKEVTTKRVEGTGRAFYLSKDVSQWRESPGVVYWGTGGPGAGKTHLAASVYDNLKAYTKPFENRVAIITYLRQDEEVGENIPTDQRVTDILMGFIIHLVEAKPLPSVLKIIDHELQEWIVKDESPDLNAVTHILHLVTKEYNRCYIVLDAIDEPSIPVRSMLLERLASLDVNILLLSRELLDDQQKLQATRRVTTKKLGNLEADIDIYINHAIDSSELLRRKLGSSEKMTKPILVRMIKDKAEGIFLHVALQIAALHDCLELQEIEDTIKAFPSGMDALYQETWKRIHRRPPGHVQRAKIILNWLDQSRRPLFFDDLHYALMTYPDYMELNTSRHLQEIDIETVCCGLVSIDRDTHRVRLVHGTARRALSILLEEDRKDKRTANPEGPPHQMIAKTCLSILTFFRFNETTIQTYTQLNELLVNNGRSTSLEYAYQYVGYHIREGLKEKSETPSDPSSLRCRVLQFVRSCTAFPYYHPLLAVNDKELSSTVQWLQPLHVACLFNLPGDLFSEILQEEKARVNARSTTFAGEKLGGWSPLMIACAEGHLEPVQALFRVDLLETNMVVEGMSPLTLASYRGHYAVVKKLIDDSKKGGALHSFGQLVGSTSRRRFAPTSESVRLSMAYAAHIGNMDILRTLWDITSIDPHDLFTAKHKALEIAVRYDRGEVIKLFEDLAANSKGPTGKTPLMLAAEFGSKEVVAALLKAPGLDPSDRDNDSKTAMDFAASKGHIEVVKLLSPHASARDLGFSLYQAIWHGRTETAAYLITAPKIELNAYRRGGRTTPLMQACLYGRTAIVQLLLAIPEVDVNLASKTSRQSPLLLASKEGRVEVVKLLLAVPGIDINFQDEKGMSALMHAVVRQHVEIVKLFLAAPGIDLTLRESEDGDTVLMLACQEDDPEIVELLLSVLDTESVNATNTEATRTALIQASRTRNLEMMKLLLAVPGIDVNLSDINHWTPLMFAAGSDPRRPSNALRGTERRVEAVKLLLAMPGIDINNRSVWSVTALGAAASEGYEEVVELLLSLPEVEVNVQNGDGETPLCLIASRERSERVVKLLLADPRIDINLRDSKGLSPLDKALKWNRHEIVELLKAASEGN